MFNLPVGDPLGRFRVCGFATPEVTLAATAGYRLPGAEQAWAGHFALVNGVAQANLEPGAAAQISRRGDAGSNHHGGPFPHGARVR